MNPEAARYMREPPVPPTLTCAKVVEMDRLGLWAAKNLNAKQRRLWRRFVRPTPWGSIK